jgi:uncharacterized protein
MATGSVYFQNNLRQRIAGRIYNADIPSEKGVIFCHGLFSSKDGYKITSLAGDIVSSGHTLLTFDFSFVGESGGNISELSVLQEVKDLECAADFFRGCGIREISLIGSSMGGTVSLLYAAGRKDISSLTLIATPATLTDFSRHAGKADIDYLPDDGFSILDGIRIKNGFFKELAGINVIGAAGRISAPALIIHGSADRIVDVSNAKAIHEKIPSEKELIIIHGGDHNLTSDRDMDILRSNILKWIRVHSR